MKIPGWKFYTSSVNREMKKSRHVFFLSYKKEVWFRFCQYSVWFSSPNTNFMINCVSLWVLVFSLTIFKLWSKLVTKALLCPNMLPLFISFWMFVQIEWKQTHWQHAWSFFICYLLSSGTNPTNWIRNQYLWLYFYYSHRMSQFCR